MKCAADSKVQTTSTITSLARRKAITATSAGIAAALAFSGRAKAAECTPGERSNVQIVNEFCAAWCSHNRDTLMSFFVDHGAYRVSETQETRQRETSCERTHQELPGLGTGSKSR
jgi:hypothetical protein